jgi:hypothetical protein
VPYPPSVPPNTRANLTSQDTAHPSDHNTIANALTDIINELGADPSGAAATVQARIAAIEANSWVTTVKIADANVTTAKIADGQITSAKIADGTIATADIADGQITATKVAAQAFTNANQSGNNLVVGVGGWSEMRWHQVGKLVFYYADVNIGSSGFLVGAVTLNLPTPAAQVGNVAWQHNYVVKFYDASANVWYAGGARLLNATTYELLVLTTFGVPVYAALSATAPFTWAVNDRMMIAGWYEAA